jgi:hypothetical protein
MTKNNLYEHQKAMIVSAYFILGTLEFSNVDISIWVSILSPSCVIMRDPYDIRVEYSYDYSVAEGSRMHLTL